MTAAGPTVIVFKSVAFSTLMMNTGTPVDLIPFTLWAFLTQVICPVGCCRLAVARVMAWLAAHGQPPCGPGTGGYCKARTRLSEGLFSLACGAIADVAVGPSRGKQSGENALQRQIGGGVESGSVLLADRYFGRWFDLALWRERGVDVVTRIHPKRATDFRRGRRLGYEDHVVVWRKRQRPG